MPFVVWCELGSNCQLERKDHFQYDGNNNNNDNQSLQYQRSIFSDTFLKSELPVLIDNMCKPMASYFTVPSTVI